MIERVHRAGGTRSTAVYSDCERYRLSLTRIWDATARRMLFVMLNPSKATERRNDPTVERCERRARALGYGAVRVCNIFAWRETDPRALRRAVDPVGDGNDDAITAGSLWAHDTLCAWGVHGAHLDRGRTVERLLRTTGRPLAHLGLTKDGHPRHPLYVAYARHPETWPETWEA